MPIHVNWSKIPLDNDTIRKMKQTQIEDTVSFSSLMLKILIVSAILGVIGLVSWLFTR